MCIPIRSGPMPSRNERAAIAAETVQIIATGSYSGPSGNSISVLSELNHSINESRLFTQGQLQKLAARTPAEKAPPQIRVSNAAPCRRPGSFMGGMAPSGLPFSTLPPPVTPEADFFRARRRKKKAWREHPGSMRPLAG